MPLILIGIVGMPESFAEEFPIDARQNSLWTGDFTFHYPANWRLDESFRDTFDVPVHDRSVLDSALSRSVPGMPLISIYHLYGHTYGDFGDQQYLELLTSISKKHCDDSFKIYGYTCTDYSVDAEIIDLDGTKAYQIIHTWTESNDEVNIQRTSVIMDFIKGNEIWTIQSINRSVNGEYFVPHEEIDLALNSFKFTNYPKFDVETSLDYDSTIALYDATYAKVEKSFSDNPDDSRTKFLKEKTLKNMLKNIPIILEGKYTNTELGFSINYPKGWHVHDEIISYPFTLGINSGTDVLVSVSPKPFETDTPYLSVSIQKDHVPSKYVDYQYLDYLQDETFDACDNSERYFGTLCTDYSVLGVGFTKVEDGNRAYVLKDTWTETYSDGVTYTFTRYTFDVVSGKDVWRLESTNFPLYDGSLVYDEIMYESLKSFTFIDSENIQITSPSIDPEPILELNLTEPTCGAGTESVNGICQVIKTDEKSSDQTSFFENIFEFFKFLFN